MKKHVTQVAKEKRFTSFHFISNAHSTEKEFVKRTDVYKCCGPHGAKTLK